MHFHCTLADLLPAISLVEKAVASQNNIPIITGIHIAAANDQLTLTATNLKLGIKSVINAHVVKANQIVVDGKLLAAIVRKLPDNPVIFELVNQQLVITSGNVEFSLNTFEGEDFPQLPQGEDLLFSITAKQFIKMVKNTIFACGKDDRRPFLNGVLFELNDSRLSLVATDINRLAFYSDQVESSHKGNKELLVPMKTLQEIIRSIPADDTRIDVYYSNNYLIFEYGKNMITTRLIDDQFPRYKSLFPKDEPIQITVNRQILASAVERASLIDSDDGSQIVIFDASNGVLEITTPASSKGRSMEKINVEHKGENGRAAFSAKYIMDMLKATDAEQVLFHFNSDLRQCLLKADTDEDQKYILMPIRLS